MRRDASQPPHPIDAVQYTSYSEPFLTDTAYPQFVTVLCKTAAELHTRLITRPPVRQRQMSYRSADRTVLRTLTALDDPSSLMAFGAPDDVHRQNSVKRHARDGSSGSTQGLRSS